MMIISPNIVGLRTSTQASRTTSVEDFPGCASDMCRTEFSTMITELSISTPKSIAPRLIKLPAIPVAIIMLLAKRNDSGIDAATINPARSPPPKTNSAATTSVAPISRLCSAVAST